jgi:hypothetical protein
MGLLEYFRNILHRQRMDKRMDKVVFFSPSLYAHVINAFLLLTAVILLFSNYSKIKSIEPYKKIILVVLFSIMIGVHGLSHLGLEFTYGYNPMIIEKKRCLYDDSR